MKILVIGSIHTYETINIIDAAKKLGHTAQACQFKDIYFEIKDTKFSVKHESLDILSFDIFIFRGITSSKPQKSNLYNALILAKYLHANGKRVIDKKLATQTYIASKIEYTLTASGIPTPNTVMTLGTNVTYKYLETAVYPLIIKATTGSKGRGVFLASNIDEAKNILKENDSKRFLFQEYLPSRFDIRVFVIGNKLLGAMRRDAKQGDFRSNIAQGGIASVYDLKNDSRIEKLAIDACNACSVEIGGVDIMVNEERLYVLEVNRTPQFQGFSKATGIDVGSEIVKYAAS